MYYKLAQFHFLAMFSHRPLPSPYRSRYGCAAVHLSLSPMFYQLLPLAIVAVASVLGFVLSYSRPAEEPVESDK